MSRARRLAQTATALVAAGLLTAAVPHTPWKGWWNARPASAVERVTVPPPRVDLERRPTTDGVAFVAHNGLSGPVEVRLHAEGRAPGSASPLTARAVLAAGARRTLLEIADPVTGHPVHARLEVVPGIPGARHQDVEYLYPLRDAPLRISQGFAGRASHSDAENRYAVDFAADEGTPVVAARDGIVMQFESTVSANQPEPHAPGVPTNFVRVLHDDGTMALYAHLQRGGVVVTPGRHVRRGQIIAFSGNTGASSGPHLHFAVHANRGMALHSVPFRMFGPHGILRFAIPENTPAP